MWDCPIVKCLLANRYDITLKAATAKMGTNDKLLLLCLDHTSFLVRAVTPNNTGHV